MKKGCLIAVVVLVVLMIVAGGIVYYQINKQLGLSESKPVSHTAIAGEDTKFRLALKTEGLEPRLSRFLPEDLAIPSAVPWEREELLEKLLPREIAVLATPHPLDEQIALQLFANEKRGGPIMAEQAKQTNALAQIPGVQWQADGLRLEQRGVLHAEGHMPLSKSGNAWVNKRFLPAKDLTPLALSGEHQLEFVLDNRHGEALLMIASLMENRGQSWDTFSQEPMAVLALEICTRIQDCRFMADWKSMDRIEIKIVMHASKDAGEQIVTATETLLIPNLKVKLQQDYGIYFTGETEWQEAEGQVVGEFTLSGIEAVVHQYLSTGSIKKEG